MPASSRHDTTFEVHDVLRLGPRERETLRASMLQVLDACWDQNAGLDGAPDSLRMSEAYLDETLDTKIHEVFDEVTLFRRGDRIVGYFQVHTGTVDVGGRHVERMRVQSNVRPEARHGSLVSRAYRHATWRYIRRRWRSRHPLYFCGWLTPVAYYFAHRRARFVYPSPSRRATDEMIRVHRATYGAAEHGEVKLLRVAPSKLDARTLEWLRASPHPALRFYREHNPRYEDGFVLPTVIRLQPIDFAYGAAVSVGFAVQSQLRRWTR